MHGIPLALHITLSSFLPFDIIILLINFIYRMHIFMAYITKKNVSVVYYFLSIFVVASNWVNGKINSLK